VLWLHETFPSILFSKRKRRVREDITEVDPLWQSKRIILPVLSSRRGEFGVSVLYRQAFASSFLNIKQD
jgi:hypothetical protein